MIRDLDYILVKLKHDLVGIYSSGYIYTGLANSLGQFNWHSDYSFSFDIRFIIKTIMLSSLTTHQNWSDDDFDLILDQGMNKLSILSKPQQTIQKENTLFTLSHQFLMRY